MRSRGRDTGGPRRHIGGGWRAALVLALVLAAGLIGAGSASSSLTGGTPPLPRSAIAIPLETVALLAVVAWAAILALIVYGLWPQGRRRRRSEFELVPQRWRAPWPVQVALLSLSVALVAGMIVALAMLRLHGISGGGAASPSPSAPAPQATSSSGPAPQGAESVWWLPFLMVGSLVLAAVVLLGYLSRSAARSHAPRAQAAGVPRDIVEESLEVLRQEPDPRRAVIRAYAAMEVALGRRGFPRRPFEAPLEYLARVLGDLHIEPSHVSALTNLFELARFSQHEVGESQRAAAIEMLHAIREELAAAAD